MEVIMKYNTEQKVKDALKINSWQNLSKDKILEFVAMMPEVDIEVAKKIIEQFPEFIAFAKLVLENMKTAFLSVNTSNSENQKAINDHFDSLSRVLENQLESDDLPFEEKKYYIDKLFELSEMRKDSDKENKRFLSEMVDKYFTSSAMLVFGVIVFIGGKVYIDKGK